MLSLHRARVRGREHVDATANDMVRQQPRQPKGRCCAHGSQIGFEVACVCVATEQRNQPSTDAEHLCCGSLCDTCGSRQSIMWVQCGRCRSRRRQQPTRRVRHGLQIPQVITSSVLDATGCALLLLCCALCFAVLLFLGGGGGFITNIQIAMLYMYGTSLAFWPA